jgi:hypothetical protein
MKKNLLLLLALVAMCVTIYAQPSALSIEIPGTHSAIVVDGFPDDALWSTEIDPQPFPYTFQDPRADAADIDATIQIAWSELGLLMYLDMTDDLLNLWTDGENTWEQDNDEFFYYFGEEGTWGADAEVTAVSGDSLFSQIRIQMTDEEVTTTDGRFCGEWAAAPFGPADLDSMEAMAVSTGFGWAIEVIMPWNMFAMTYPAEVGMKFGFDVCVGDADEAIRDNQLSLLNDSGTDAAWDNKSYLNTAILGEMPESNIPSYLVNRVSVYPTLVDNLIHVTGKVSSATIYNVTGQPVLSIKDNNIATIDVSALKAGIYFVSLNNVTTQKIVVR